MAQGMREGIVLVAFEGGKMCGKVEAKDVAAWTLLKNHLPLLSLEGARC